MSFFNSIIESILKSNQSDESERPDVSRTEVDGKFIGEAVNPYLNEHAENGHRLPLDGKYYTISKEDMEKIVKENQVNRNEYKEALYDCENFALSFMAEVQEKYGVTAVGLVIDWSGTHAYNMFIYDDGSVELYEPQSDTFVEPGSEELYSFENVRVIV